jgi:CubicO group peptidase (beta-lactamase class C family)
LLVNYLFYVLIIAEIFLISGCSSNTELNLKQTSAVTEDSVFANQKKLRKQLNADEKAIKINRFFEELYQKRGFNGNVLISQQGIIIYKRCFGWFNKEKKEPLTEQSVFQLASLSKQFTAIAILMLYEQKKIHLDEDIRTFFPQLPYSGITVKMLLTHRSGLPDYRYFCDGAYCCKNIEINNQQVIDLICEKKPGLYYKPNTHFDYNNTNYLLLASIIEKVSGITYEQFLRTKIFEPLGMKNTFVYDKMDFPQGVALGYSAGWRRIWNDYQNGTIGDKNIYSTINDLYIWDTTLYTNKLLKQETLRLAYLPYSPELKTRNYGFGYRLKCLPTGDDIVFHGGWWRGYNHLYYRRLRDKTAIIVLSNRVNFVFNDLSTIWDILDERTNNSSPSKTENDS